MTKDLFPNLADRLGVTRHTGGDDDFERAARAEMAERDSRDRARTRSTDLSDFRWRQDARQRAAQRSKSDPGRVRDLLSRLVTEIEGRPLSDFVPMAQAVPLLLGISPSGANTNFGEFLGSFITTVTDLGRVVSPPSVTRTPESVSANRRYFAARSMGVSAEAAAKVQPGRTRAAKRFDELSAMFSDGRTLAAVLADGNDGLPPGTAEVIGGMFTAIRNSLLAGDEAGARQAGTDAGILVAALHTVFEGGTNAQRREIRTRASGAPMAELAPGIWADAFDCERDSDGRPRLRAGCGTPELRRRIREAGGK